MSNGCSEKVMVKCSDNNYMSKKNINTENYYQNRRELKTKLSKSDLFKESSKNCPKL